MSSDTTTNPGRISSHAHKHTGAPRVQAPQPWCTRTAPSSSRLRGEQMLGQQRRRRRQSWPARRRCGAQHAPCSRWWGGRDWGMVCARHRVEHLPPAQQPTAGSATPRAWARCSGLPRCSPMRGWPGGPLLLAVALSKARSETTACRRPGHCGGCHRTVQVWLTQAGKLASEWCNTLNKGGFGVKVKSCWIGWVLLAS